MFKVIFKLFKENKSVYVFISLRYYFFKWVHICSWECLRTLALNILTVRQLFAWGSKHIKFGTTPVGLFGRFCGLKQNSRKQLFCNLWYVPPLIIPLYNFSILALWKFTNIANFYLNNYVICFVIIFVRNFFIFFF